MHQAYVVHRGHRRKSRGFSTAEMVEAGLTCEQSCELNLPWDPKRKSVNAENLKYLKSLAKK